MKKFCNLAKKYMKLFLKGAISFAKYQDSAHQALLNSLWPSDALYRHRTEANTESGNLLSEPMLTYHEGHPLAFIPG